MGLLKLKLKNFRNLEFPQLGFSPHFNFIFGANGSGKSSLLEAIGYLSFGRSFRTQKHEAVVRHGAPGLTVFGLVSDLASSSPPDSDGESFQPQHRLGISRDLQNRETTLKLDGERVRALSSLARLFPLLAIDPGAFEIVSGGPGRRRQFVDWATFHVEHQFGREWQRLQRVTSQRNQLLRSGRIDDSVMRVWNEQYLALSEQVTQYRRQCLGPLKVLIEKALMLAEVPWRQDFSLDFFQGWDTRQELASVLHKHADQEKRVGHTLFGPHRADLRFKVDGRPAQDVLSRGQQKTLVILLKVAQVELLHSLGQRQCTFLIDDINAELDRENRQRLLQRLEELGTQVFITGIDAGELRDSQALVSTESTLFHVEHGRVAEV